jgi:VIT1/CCC1 family predicted Fe2+/Mn2+ transporter
MVAAAPRHSEWHRSRRSPWLRAAVLGANDGLLSTAALLVGVASGDAGRETILLAGFAALAAGALSMAVGEYGSVSAQRDAEMADLRREARELRANPEAERQELARIYRDRGLSAELAARVAGELMDHGDQLAIHARDELGLELGALARPVQAAAVSACAFVVGGVVPLAAAALVGDAGRVAVVVGVTLAGLAALGALGARLGGAGRGRAAVRVLVGGGLALAAAALVGSVAGAVI